MRDDRARRGHNGRQEPALICDFFFSCATIQARLREFGPKLLYRLLSSSFAILDCGTARKWRRARRAPQSHSYRSVCDELRVMYPASIVTESVRGRLRSRDCDPLYFPQKKGEDVRKLTPKLASQASSQSVLQRGKRFGIFPTGCTVARAIRPNDWCGNSDAGGASSNCSRRHCRRVVKHTGKLFAESQAFLDKTCRLMVVSAVPLVSAEDQA